MTKDDRSAGQAGTGSPLAASADRYDPKIWKVQEKEDRNHTPLHRAVKGIVGGYTSRLGISKVEIRSNSVGELAVELYGPRAHGGSNTVTIARLRSQLESLTGKKVALGWILETRRRGHSAEAIAEGAARRLARGLRPQQAIRRARLDAERLDEVIAMRIQISGAALGWASRAGNYRRNSVPEHPHNREGMDYGSASGMSPQGRFEVRVWLFKRVPTKGPRVSQGIGRPAGTARNLVELVPGLTPSRIPQDLDRRFEREDGLARVGTIVNGERSDGVRRALERLEYNTKGAGRTEEWVFAFRDVVIGDGHHRLRILVVRDEDLPNFGVMLSWSGGPVSIRGRELLSESLDNIGLPRLPDLARPLTSS